MATGPLGFRIQTNDIKKTPAPVEVVGKGQDLRLTEVPIGLRDISYTLLKDLLHRITQFGEVAPVPAPLSHWSSHIKGTLIEENVELDGDRLTRESLLLMSANSIYLEGELPKETLFAWLLALPSDHSNPYLLAASFRDRADPEFPEIDNPLISGIHVQDEDADGRSEVAFTIYDPWRRHHEVKTAFPVPLTEERSDSNQDQRAVYTFLHYMDGYLQNQKLAEAVFRASDAPGEEFLKVYPALESAKFLLWHNIIGPVIDDLERVAGRLQPVTVPLRDLKTFLRMAQPHLALSQEGDRSLEAIRRDMAGLAGEYRARQVDPRGYWEGRDPAKRARTHDDYIRHYIPFWEGELQLMVHDLNQTVQAYGYRDYAAFMLEQRYGLSPEAFEERCQGLYRDPMMRREVRQFVDWLRQVQREIEPDYPGDVRLCDVTYLAFEGLKREGGVAEHPVLTEEETRAVLHAMAREELGVDLTQPPYSNIVWDMVPRLRRGGELYFAMPVDADHSYFRIFDDARPGFNLNEIREIWHELVHAVYYQGISTNGIFARKHLDGMPLDLVEGQAFTLELLFYDVDRLRHYFEPYEGFGDRFLAAYAKSRRGYHFWRLKELLAAARVEVALYRDEDRPLAERLQFWKDEVRSELLVEPSALAYGDYVGDLRPMQASGGLQAASYTLGFQKLYPRFREQGPRSLMGSLDALVRE